MNTTIKSGAILILMLISSVVDHAAGNNLLSGAKDLYKTEAAINSGQGNLKLKEEPEDRCLFPLGNAILNRL